MIFICVSLIAGYHEYFVCVLVDHLDLMFVTCLFMYFVISLKIYLFTIDFFSRKADLQTYSLFLLEKRETHTEKDIFHLVIQIC